jgi:multiple sugar transport system ATP-binding protein
MGRAIIRKADAFLFDEPLSNLDAKLRGQMRAEISRIQRRLGITTVYVTHDQTEAMTLGDRIAVLRKGLLQQVGTPHDLYDSPANLFVAGFIGSPPMNFIPGRVRDGAIETPFGDISVTTDRLRGSAGHELVIVGIRPQHFEDASILDAATRARGQTFTAHVDVTEWLGDQLYAYVPYDAPHDVTQQLKELQRELDSEQMRTQLIVALSAESRITDGTVTDLWFGSEQVHIFDPASGENLTQYAARPEPVGPSSTSRDQLVSSEGHAPAEQAET